MRALSPILTQGWHETVQILEEAALHERYTRVISTEPALNDETEDVCALLKECIDLRCAPCPITFELVAVKALPLRRVAARAPATAGMRPAAWQMA